MTSELNETINHPKLLLEYRFSDTIFHSISFDPEWSVLVLGTNKGTLLNYFIKVGNDIGYFDDS